MTMLRTSITIWRRAILLGLAMLVALLASNAAAPATAEAIMINDRVPAQHVGWVYTQNLAPCLRCSISHEVWRWTGSSWETARVAGGARVYVYPYSGSWHWIWTPTTGWLAIENTRLERFPQSYICSLVCL